MQIVGVRLKSWTGLCRNSKTLPVFEGAERAERDLDPSCVVPPDVRVEDLDELIYGRSPPVARIKQFRLQSPEEAFTSCVIGRASFA